MKNGQACVIFLLGGQSYEYDGDWPEALSAHLAAYHDADGFWRTDYPNSIAAAMKDPWDELPTVLWEIGQIGGRVTEIRGAQPDGSIHLEDWKRPIIN